MSHPFEHLAVFWLSGFGLMAGPLMTGGPPRSMAPLRRTAFPPHRPHERHR